MSKKPLRASGGRYRAALGAVLALAVQPATPLAAEPVTPNLTPRLHELLQEEMQAVSQSMEKILTGMVEGDHSVVTTQAKRIHDSFILKQELTPKDKQDLKAAVPPEFVRLDQEFHKMAKRLAHVAEERKDDLELFYFGEMVEACKSCHEEFVSDRFPGFSKGPMEGEHTP